MVDQPIIMGVLNITPDSFSDGGLFFEAQSAKLTLKFPHYLVAELQKNLFMVKIL